MKTAMAFFFFATLIWAEDNPANQFKHVASVRWDLETGKLEWVVQNGSMGDKGFVPSSEESYEISLKDSIMTFQGQKRGFTTKDATRLEDLLRILTGYCVARTIWWLTGEDPTPTDEKPTAPPSSEPDPATPPAPIGSPVGAVVPHYLAIPTMIQPASQGPQR